MRRLLLAFLLITACSGANSAPVRAAGQADGGVASPAVVPLDAGVASVDAGATGAVDAGALPVYDAGTADAGVASTPDAGGQTADAGPGAVLDAGAADAGSPATADAGALTSTYPNSGLLPSSASGWTAFAPRPQSAPATSVADGTDGYVLKISGNQVANVNVYGGWTAHVTGLSGGADYRFNARARPLGVASIRESVTVVLQWHGTFGEEVSPDYVWDFDKQADGSLLFDRTIQAPPGATNVDVQLVLQWSPGGQVSFDKLSLTAAAAPAERHVRVASVYYRPASTASGLASVQQAGQYAAQVATTYHPDVIVLGETLNFIGAPGGFDTNAETVPGPSTNYLAGIASAHHVNIAFGMVEKAGNTLFNTAVLIDRTGVIIGKHHKVQLPLAEASAGIAPGSAVEVFDADFGRVALLICQETSFPEPAREAALQGAELLLVPIWGGKTALVHARAIENGIYLAAAGYDYASEVVDPLGAVLASVVVNNGAQVAIADLDLGKRFRVDYLGDWRDISNKERRTAPYSLRLP